MNIKDIRKYSIEKTRIAYAYRDIDEYEYHE